MLGGSTATVLVEFLPNIYPFILNIAKLSTCRSVFRALTIIEVKLVVEIINALDFKPLIIFAKSFIFDGWQGSKYTSNIINVTLYYLRKYKYRPVIRRQNDKVVLSLERYFE